MLASVANTEPADVHAPRSLAQYRVPHRRCVARRVDAVPRARRAVDGRGDAGLEELALGGDLTRGGVDEEHAHRGGA